MFSLHGKMAESQDGGASSQFSFTDEGRSQDQYNFVDFGGTQDSELGAGPTFSDSVVAPPDFETEEGQAEEGAGDGTGAGGLETEGERELGHQQQHLEQQQQQQVQEQQVQEQQVQGQEDRQANVAAARVETLIRLRLDEKRVLRWWRDEAFAHYDTINAQNDTGME